MKVNITQEPDLDQVEYDDVSSLTVHDDGSLIVRTNKSGFMYEPDEWTAFAVERPT